VSRIFGVGACKDGSQNRLTGLERRGRPLAGFLDLIAPLLGILQVGGSLGLGDVDGIGRVGGRKNEDVHRVILGISDSGLGKPGIDVGVAAADG
jgi:hypothetical protein